MKQLCFLRHKPEFLSIAHGNLFAHKGVHSVPLMICLSRKNIQTVYLFYQMVGHNIIKILLLKKFISVFFDKLDLIRLVHDAKTTTLVR